MYSQPCIALILSPKLATAITCRARLQIKKKVQVAGIGFFLGNDCGLWLSSSSRHLRLPCLIFF